VIKQLEPMDKTRKCYRLIGDVLVERTVAETLPAGVYLTMGWRG
jgi:prefoldin subunit 2